MKKQIILITVGLMMVMQLSAQKTNIISFDNISDKSLNVLYKGLDNPVTIAAFGVSSDQLSIESEIAIIRATDIPGKYIITLPEEIEKESCEVLIRYNNKTKRLICEIRNLPEVRASFKDFTGGDIHKHDLHKLEKLNVYLDDFLWDDFKEWDIEFYRIIVQPQEGHTTVMEIRGAELTEPAKELIQQQEVGAKIIITNIMSYNPLIGEVFQIPFAIMIDVAD